MCSAYRVDSKVDGLAVAAACFVFDFETRQGFKGREFFGLSRHTLTLTLKFVRTPPEFASL